MSSKQQLLNPIRQQEPTPSLTLSRRPRRNRQSAAIRALVRETTLHPCDLVNPLFIVDGCDEEQPIASMPDVSRKSIDRTLQEVEDLYSLGIRAVVIFTKISSDLKDNTGSEALRPNNLMQQAIRTLKKEFPEMCIMTDIALDPFTDHGHDGIVDPEGKILNDKTLEALAEMSLRAAEAGIDIVAPSDMMDGRVAYIRHVLDTNGFTDVGILSYTAKYASAMYGPFRDALGSSLSFGDKKTYQMDPANAREALIEAALDEAEGADFLLVKPALHYLDILARIRQITHLPLAAYHVSGEYAMVMAAAEKGWLDADDVLMETTTAIKRAGADLVFTYAAKRLAKLIYTS